ncbi:MAG: alpha/beta fold hydrolase [Solirubrobacterales bacterium]
MSGAAQDPLLLVHGFAQTPQSWQTVIEVMGKNRVLHAIELPGHGATALTRGEPTVKSARQAVLDEIAGLRTEHVAIWGYSQGARVALDAVLHNPENCSALILESGTAGIDDPLARADRRSRDVALGSRIAAGSIEDFVGLWERVPALGDQSAELIEQQRPDRLAHDPVALGAALQGIGQAAYDPMWNRLNEIEIPVLLISGERDRVYTRHARHMAEAITNAKHVVVPDAGHCVHLERPAEAVTAVEGFLNSA